MYALWPCAFLVLYLMSLIGSIEFHQSSYVFFVYCRVQEIINVIKITVFISLECTLCQECMKNEPRHAKHAGCKCTFVLFFVPSAVFGYL